MTITETAPRRWKTPEELTHEEQNAVRRSARHRPVAPDRIETPEWRAHVEAQRVARAELRAAAEHDITRANADLGRAIVDGTSASGARKRLEEARAAIEGLDQVDAELLRRDEEERQAYVAAAESAARARAYRWMSAFLTLAERVLAARSELLAAEEALKAVGTNDTLANMRLREIHPEEMGFDPELFKQVPKRYETSDKARLGERGHVFHQGHGNTGLLDVERCRVLREKADRVAGLEEAA